MAIRRNRKSRSLAAKSAELAFAAPQVMFLRLARMATAGPVASARDRKEFSLMGSEKAAAFHDSWNAMAVQSMRANQALAASFLRAFWSPRKPSAAVVASQWHRAGMGILAKGLAPVHRTTVANAKRLARAKSR